MDEESNPLQYLVLIFLLTRVSRTLEENNHTMAKKEGPERHHAIHFLSVFYQVLPFCSSFLPMSLEDEVLVL